MFACALSGIELTLMPPWMVPRLRVVRGSSGRGVSASAARAVESAAMGLGMPASVKLWPAGAGNGDLVAAAAKGLSDGGVGAGAIENDVGGDAAGEWAVLVDMAHAAQVALPFFANVAEDDERNRQRDTSMDEARLRWLTFPPHQPHCRSSRGLQVGLRRGPG